MLNAKVVFLYDCKELHVYEVKYTCLNFKRHWRSGGKIKIFLMHRSEMKLMDKTCFVQNQATFFKIHAKIIII